MKQFLLLSFGLILGNAVRAQTPTYAADVAHILYANCTNCHRDGGVAPFPLESFGDAEANAGRIRTAVLTRHMPPWPPDHAYRSFHGERLLRQGQIDSIVAWVDAGAPRGDAAMEPPAPVFSTRSRLAFPIDTTYKIPTYTVSSNQDLYRCYVIPGGLRTQQWIRGIEMVAGNGAIVHHMLLYADTTGQCRSFDQADPDPGYTSFGGVGASSATLLGGWVPGADPIELTQGFGIRISRRADLVLQVHYAPGSLGLQDSSYFRFSYAPAGSVRREVYQAPILNHFTTLQNGPLALAANEQKTFKESFTAPLKVSLLSVSPHAHLINRNWKVYALPVGHPQDTVPLIKIPDWHFHWQGQYRFEHPVVLNLGDKMQALAWFDNTGGNAENPNSPPLPVVAGEGTHDEMMMVYVAFVVYQPGDETLQLFDTAAVTKAPAPVAPSNWALYGYRVRSATGAFPQGWQMRTMEGRLVASGTGSEPVPVKSVAKGVYVLWVEDQVGGTPLRVVAGD